MNIVRLAVPIFFLSLAPFVKASITSSFSISVLPASTLKQNDTHKKQVIFLNGALTEASPSAFASSLANLNVQPGQATVYMNSPGGNLAAGIEIGRIIRRYGLSTAVGRINRDSSTIERGDCYSACSLAFLGGKFRFSIPGSRIGVHRFAPSNPVDSDIDATQIVFAAITAYLTEMGMNSQFVDRMVRAGPDQIYILSDAESRQMKVINDGQHPASWSLEVADAGVYLRGSQDSWKYGQTKTIFWCVNGSLLMLPMFDKDSYADINARKFELRIDNTSTALTAPLRWASDSQGTLAGMFTIPHYLHPRLTKALSIGFTSYDAKGVSQTSFAIDASDGRGKIRSFINNCRK